MSNSHIRILSGAYRGKSVAGMCFELVEQLTTTGKNTFVKVRNNGVFPNMPETIRVNVTGTHDYEFITQGESMLELVATKTPTKQIETEEEATVAIDEARESSEYRLTKSSCEYKNKKEKGEIVEEFYKLTLKKDYD